MKVENSESNANGIARRRRTNLQPPEEKENATNRREACR